MEAFRTSSDDLARPTSFVGPALRDRESPVALLDVVPGIKEKQVVAVQRSGILTTFSEDLQTTHVETLLSSHHKEGLVVLAAQILTLTEAQKTILKRRPDVVSTAVPDGVYLAVAYGLSGQGGSINNLWYGVWTLDSAAGNLTSREKSSEPLFEHELSPGKYQSKSLNNRSCSFVSRASNLFVRSEQTLMSYDLTGMVPSLSSTLHTGLSGSYELMAISPAFAICSSQDTLRLYDLKYQAAQTQRVTKQANLKRKRHKAADNGGGPIEFVAYYPESSRIIGIRGNQLLAIDLAMVASKRMLETGSTLLHNIGRGIVKGGTALEQSEKQPLLQYADSTVDSESTTDWESLRKRLDQFAEADDVVGFESAFITHVQKAMPVTTTDASSDNLTAALAVFPDFKVNYILSRIFRMTHSSDPEAGGQSISTMRLKVQLRSIELISWISRLGLLSGGRVETAIANSARDIGGTIPSHAVTQALLDTDPSYALLTGCLTNGFSPYVEEQAAVVQLLIQRALDSSEKPIVAEPGFQRAGTMDVELPINAVASQARRSPPSSSEEHQLPRSLQGALIAALDRFGTHAGSTILTKLKALFSQTEVLALIQFLRQQLFQAGHTRIFHAAAAIESAPRSVRLDAAIKILSGCVDAIGPLGFFGALDNEDFLGNIIPELVAEVANTKQSLDDVSELQGILREALRYQESIQRQRAAGARIPGHMAGGVPQQRPGAIVTVYTEAIEGEEDLQPGSALPLSLKVDGVVNPVKMRKGGGQVKQRTLRQKKMLERRNKGQYSFERLVL